MLRFDSRLTSVALLIAGLSPLLAGCNEPVTAQAATQPVAPEVSVVTVVPKPHAMVRELPGRIAPPLVADVRPRVSGIITERLFKQGSEGDAHGDKPGMTDFVGRYKFEAWEALRGTAREQAMEQYIALVEELRSGAAS